MLIDWHTNLALPEHLAPDEGGAFQSRVGINLEGTPESHRENVAEAAERFVVVTMQFPLLRMHVPNEFVADYIKAYGDRAKAFAATDPFESKAARKLEEAIVDLGLHGLKISPVYGGFHPWADEAVELYKVCDRLGVPLLWHQSAGYAQDSTLENGNPILLDKIAREFPKLRMIVAHVGQPWIGETVVLLRKHPQIFSDVSARFHRKWQLYNAIMLAIEYKVADRLLFGSDFPLRSTRSAVEEFRGLNDWGEGVSMPKVPAGLIEEIIHDRPLELVWPDG